MAQTTLAEALLHRKELSAKVEQLKELKTRDIFNTRVSRRGVSEGVDEIIAQVPYMTAGQVTHEYDWHSRQLRLLDAAIQQANWGTKIEVGDACSDYKCPEEMVKPKDDPVPQQALQAGEARPTSRSFRPGNR